MKVYGNKDYGIKAKVRWKGKDTYNNGYALIKGSEINIADFKKSTLSLWIRMNVAEVVIDYLSLSGLDEIAHLCKPEDQSNVGNVLELDGDKWYDQIARLCQLEDQSSEEDG